MRFRDDDMADLLKEWRKRGEMSQREAAEVLGVPLFTMRAWEQRRTRPTPEMPVRIAIEALAGEMGILQPADLTCYRFGDAT